MNRVGRLLARSLFAVLLVLALSAHAASADPGRTPSVQTETVQPEDPGTWQSDSQQPQDPGFPE